MTRSKSLSDTSRIELKLNDHVILLEIDGLPGWHLPTDIHIASGDVTMHWELVVDQPLRLYRYRIWLGESWYEFERNPIRVTPFEQVEITATLKRN